RFTRPVYGIKTSILCPAAGEHALSAQPIAFDIDRYDNALAAESVRHLGDQRGSFGRSGIDDDLLDSDLEQPVRVVERSHAAAVAQRHEALTCDLENAIEIGTATGSRGGDI